MVKKKECLVLLQYDTYSSIEINTGLFTMLGSGRTPPTIKCLHVVPGIVAGNHGNSMGKVERAVSNFRIFEFALF